MENRKVAYMSLGCKVNLYETMALIDEFVLNGFTLVDFDDYSDVYIINTCTVTQTSDSKSKKMIRQAIKRNEKAIICVMGCFSQLNIEDALGIKGVNIVTGTSNRSLVYQKTIELLENNDYDKVINLHQEFKDINCFEDLNIYKFYDRTRGFVKIQDGCENYCSYCAIPYARGRFRSRPKESIIKEIDSLSNDGVKEIVLTGINTGAYGLDLDGYSFPELLEDICTNVKNLGRLRISSIEATEVTNELLNVIKKYQDHFCMHLHIPIQSATNEVLKLMNRKYNLDFFKDTIRRVRSYFPLINITTDILTAFDGETNELFKEGFNNINEIQFGETHVFPYSPRKNTVAYKLSIKNKHQFDVNIFEKKIRVNELLTLNEKNALIYREKFIGKTVEVLVEKIEGNICFGHSSNYLEVKFEKKNAKINDFVMVRITEAGYPVSRGVEEYVR